MDADSEHIQLPAEPCPRLARYCYLVGAVAEVSKDHVIILLNQLPQNDGEQSKPMNSMSMGLLLHFICFRVISLIRSNAVSNTRMVDEEFCRSKVGNFGKSLICRECKSISRVSIPVSAENLHFHDGSSVIREQCHIRDTVLVSPLGR